MYSHANEHHGIKMFLEIIKCTVLEHIILHNGIFSSPKDIFIMEKTSPPKNSLKYFVFPCRINGTLIKNMNKRISKMHAITKFTTKWFSRNLSWKSTPFSTCHLSKIVCHYLPWWQGREGSTRLATNGDKSWTPPSLVTVTDVYINIDIGGGGFW